MICTIIPIEDKAGFNDKRIGEGESLFRMEPIDMKIVILGAGEKASAVAHGLFSKGFKRIMMTDLPHPMAERRGVSFCEAAIEQKKEICGVTCESAEPRLDAVEHIWSKGNIPLLIAPCDEFIDNIRPDIAICALMKKRNIESLINLAPLVIALGPGFYAGKDAHYVIETNPNSPDLSKVIKHGISEEQTDIPTEVLGKTVERLLLSPGTGTLRVIKDIGDSVQRDDIIGDVEDKKLVAPISGVIWGLIRTPADVKKGQKLGDIYPGNDRNICFEITPQAKLIAEGVRKAILKGIPV